MTTSMSIQLPPQAYQSVVRDNPHTPKRAGEDGRIHTDHGIPVMTETMQDIRMLLILPSRRGEVDHDRHHHRTKAAIVTHKIIIILLVAGILVVPTMMIPRMMMFGLTQWI